MERWTGSRGWLAAWTALCVAGFASTFVLPIWIATSVRHVERPDAAAAAVPIALAAGLASGLVIGGLQALLISRRVPGIAVAWIAASALGSCIALGGVVFVLTSYRGYYLPHPSIVYSLVAGCLAVGLAQSLTLGGRARWPFAWPLVKLAAVATGIGVCLVVSASWIYAVDAAARHPSMSHLPLKPMVESGLVALFCIVPPLSYGLLTGIALLGQLPACGHELGRPIRAGRSYQPDQSDFRTEITMRSTPLAGPNSKTKVCPSGLLGTRLTIE